MSRFDFSHPPFDTLSAAERDTLEANADIVFFDDESVILGPGQLVEALYVVIKGWCGRWQATR